MNIDKNTGKIVGLLFVVVMITWGLGYGLIASVLNTQGFLANVYPNKIKILVGILFELIEIAAIVGIVSLMYPIFKKFNESMAVGYIGFRIIESILLIISVVCALILIPLSQFYLETTAQDNSYFKIIASLLVELRDNGVQTILPVFYSSAAIMLNYLFYKKRLVPRLLSIWGFISAVLVVVQVPLGFFDIKLLEFAGISMGLNELVLGFWLIVKGFNISVDTQIQGKG